jgi:hypothetical protein
MEGFLEKKGAGDGIFGRRNWKERWFILEDSVLSYYESFDVITGTPLGLKGSMCITGCTLKASVAHHDRKFVFELTHKDRPSLLMCAKTDKIKSIWVKALENEISGRAYGISYTEYYSLLGLNEKDNPNLSIINRAYRRLALKAHPDKGGDITKFKKLQEAFDILAAKLDDEELDKMYDEITYQVIVQKGGKGIGLGMVVVEYPKTGAVMVKSVLPNIIIKYIDDNAGGMIHPEDILVKLGGHDVSTWPLARVSQRLGNFCTPIDSLVTLQFSRRIPRGDALHMLSGDSDDSPRDEVRIPYIAGIDWLIPFNTLRVNH